MLHFVEGLQKICEWYSLSIPSVLDQHCSKMWEVIQHSESKTVKPGSYSCATVFRRLFPKPKILKAQVRKTVYLDVCSIFKWLVYDSYEEK